VSYIGLVAITLAMGVSVVLAKLGRMPQEDCPLN